MTTSTLKLTTNFSKGTLIPNMLIEFMALNCPNITVVGAFHRVIFTFTIMYTRYELPFVSEATVFTSVWACRACTLMMRPVVA